MNYQPASPLARPVTALDWFSDASRAEQWGVRSNFTEEGVRAINDVAARHNYAAMVGSYHPDLGDKAEDEMIERGDFAGALLFRTLDEMRDSAPFRQRGNTFLGSTACFQPL